VDVIIVDDEPGGRRTLLELCADEADLRVIGDYGDGHSALAAIRARAPHLLFLDIQMTPLNGIALARALDPNGLPSIVFVTAYDDYALEAFEVCAVDYLVKPFDQERFHKTLARVRSRHAPGDGQERSLSRPQHDEPGRGRPAFATHAACQSLMSGQHEPPQGGQSDAARRLHSRSGRRCDGYEQRGISNEGSGSAEQMALCTLPLNQAMSEDPPEHEHAEEPKHGPYWYKPGRT